MIHRERIIHQKRIIIHTEKITYTWRRYTHGEDHHTHDQSLESSSSIFRSSQDLTFDDSIMYAFTATVIISIAPVLMPLEQLTRFIQSRSRGLLERVSPSHPSRCTQPLERDTLITHFKGD